MGCYSFVNHVLAHHPGVPMGFEIPSLREALTARYPDAWFDVAEGCAVEGDDRSGFTAAIDAAQGAEVAIVAVGDRAGLFGRGTVGEGNDVESLELPGVQRELVERIVATGTPVVLVVLSGRPYAIDWALEGETAPAAVLQSFFPGEEGATALAAILAGDSVPSGRLPVSLPRSAGAQPYSYLHPLLGAANEITSADSTPVRPFGFGLSYTRFTHRDLVVDADASTAGGFTARVVVENVGDRPGVDVVQLYTHDPVRLGDPPGRATRRLRPRRTRRRRAGHGGVRRPRRAAGVLRPRLSPRGGARRPGGLGRAVLRRARDGRRHRSRGRGARDHGARRAAHRGERHLVGAERDGPARAGGTDRAPASSRPAASPPRSLSERSPPARPAPRIRHTSAQRPQRITGASAEKWRICAPATRLGQGKRGPSGGYSFAEGGSIVGRNERRRHD